VGEQMEKMKKREHEEFETKDANGKWEASRNLRGG